MSNLKFSKTKALFAAFALLPAAFAQTTVKIDPRASYLRLNGESTLAAPALSLSSIGVAPGQVIRMRRLGDFHRGGASSLDNNTGMIAVFSNSTSLLSAAQLARVPGALSANCPVTSLVTWVGKLSTDIPEDFAVQLGLLDSVTLVVPIGALPVTHNSCSPPLRERYSRHSLAKHCDQQGCNASSPDLGI